GRRCSLRTFLVQRSWPRRAVVFAAALTVALSTLVASFVVARAAADAVTDPFNIICHTGNPATPSHSGDEGLAKRCMDCCSLGCVVERGGPPSRATLPVMHPAGRSLPWATTAVFPDQPPSWFYRSRAPPHSA